MRTEQKKPRSDAKLKTLPDALQERLYQELRKNSQEKVLDWLKEAHGIDTSDGALTAFFGWYPRSLTLRNAAVMSDQLAATLKKIPELNITADQAAKVAQINFELQAANNRDPELFGMLRKGQLETARLQLEREKFEESKKKDWEKGLDALLAEIKGNAEALKHFEAIKAALKKGAS